MERIINIKIFKSSKIDMDTTHWGVQNEKNITKLVFHFPEELESYNKEILFDFGAGEVAPDLIENNEYTIDDNVSRYSNINVAVRVTKADGTKLFESLPEPVTFDESLKPTNDMPTPEQVSEWNTMITALNEKIEQVNKIEENADYAKEQGDYAKQEAEKVDKVVDYVVATSEEAKEISKTAESIAKGANQCKTYGDYPTFIEAFNLIPKDKYNVGQDVRIVQVNVPDLWIAYAMEEKEEYTYTTDEDFINELVTNGIVQVGYYKFGMLETQKVNLKDYIKKDDFATKTTPGIFKPFDGYGTFMDGANLGILAATEALINNESNNYRPLTSKNYRYAVNRVINDRFVTLTQAEYDALETKDENTYYDIVEE